MIQDRGVPGGEYKRSRATIKSRRLGPGGQTLRQLFVGTRQFDSG